MATFEIREERSETGRQHYAIWLAGNERIAVLRTREAAQMLCDRLEDAWATAFNTAVTLTLPRYSADFIDPMP